LTLTDTIKSRLKKKLEHFTIEELPLLVKHGHLIEFCNIARPNLTENCKVSKDNMIQEELLKEETPNHDYFNSDNNHYD
jgi:hypothetical protein